MKILLSANTQSSIRSICSKPPHGLGIFAPIGFGKMHVAKYIAYKVLGNSPDFESQHMKIISPEENKNMVTIDQVREIHAFFKLRIKSDKQVARVLIIEDAHKMHTDAQNALLKIVEEPPSHSMIILTATSTSGLLPTILSRIERLQLSEVSTSKIHSYFSSDYNEDEISRAQIIARGRIGLIASILQKADHPLLESIESVKNFLKGDKYTQLASLNEHLNSIETFLEALKIISYSAFMQSVNKTTVPNEQAKRWLKIYKQSYFGLQDIQHNANPKILLTNLTLAI